MHKMVIASKASGCVKENLRWAERDEAGRYSADERNLLPSKDSRSTPENVGKAHVLLRFDSFLWRQRFVLALPSMTPALSFRQG